MLEAACRAWARWKLLEEKIASLSEGNILAGEVAKGANGNLQASPLRVAAREALDDYSSIAKDIGITLPGSSAALPEKDLFGYPDRPGRGQKGRPRFTVTPRDRNRVRLLLGMGWSNPRIAAALEVSLPTLHRYFKVELSERAAMRDRLDARRLEIAMDLANDGNVAALKELGRMIERSDLMSAGARIDEAQKKPKVEAIGKKALADEEAKLAGQDSVWGDDLKFPGMPN